MAHCGERLIELLEAYGIDTVFGIPGVHTIELYRGLANSRIRHVTPRHEQGAGFMADGYARATGRPAACLIVSGPGMTNIATPMGEAYADSIPMLVISSVSRTSHLALGEGRLHEMPHQRQLTAGVTAFSHTLMRPDELPRLLARAFAIFKSSRPRPVHIEIPLDVMEMPADHIDMRIAAFPNRPQPTQAGITSAVALMKSAKRPILFCGGGAVDAGNEIQRLVSHYAVPTAVTVNGRGLLPVGYPQLFNIYFTLPKMAQFVADADLIVAVGTDFGEPDYGSLFDRPHEMPSRLIRIDIDPEQLTRNRAADIAICSDALPALHALNELLDSAATYTVDPTWLSRVQEVRDETADFVHKHREMSAHEEILQSIGKILKDPIIVGDNTQPIFTANYTYESSTSRSFFNSGTGFCTLGYALPASIGAKLGCADRHVVSISGDGGFMFTLSELATAVEQKLPVVAIVWNNCGYREIEKFMLERGATPVGVKLHTPDFSLLAQAFGCRYAKVGSLEAFESALSASLGRAAPVIVEIDEQSMLTDRAAASR